MASFLLVLTTAGSGPEARRLARRLVAARAAACVNVVPSIRSFYRWKEKLEEGKESLLIIKTDRKHLAALTRLIRKHHSYELPEIIALPISHGEPDYLQWVSRSLTKPLLGRMITN